jgi:hypothetical protein
MGDDGRRSGISLAAPGFGTFLLTFVTLPKSVDKRLIRLAMAAAVVVIPALLGLVSLRMLEPGARPRGAVKVVTVMRGYPYTVGLAITLVMMTVFAPVLKVRNLARRWETQHVPMLVKPDEVEILLHPSDLVISGRERAATRARAILAERLTVTRAYLTWDKESNEVEDRIREIWQAMRNGRMDEARRRWPPCNTACASSTCPTTSGRCSSARRCSRRRRSRAGACRAPRAPPRTFAAERLAVARRTRRVAEARYRAIVSSHSERPSVTTEH